jgi:Protein of unknown function (DUF3105)
VAGSNQGGRGSGNDGRRPTKAERREEARLKREEIQRRMARRRRSRSISLVLVVLAIAVVIVAVFLTSGGGGSNANVASAADLLKQAPAAKQSAGCDPLQSTPNYANAQGADPSIDHAHIGSSQEVATAPALSTYATIPPASGPHNSVPLPAGIYSSPPDVFRTIHSLEHGAVIIWYAPGTTGKALDELLAFYGQPESDAVIGQAKIIIAPYDYPDQGTAGQLPSGIQMAVVAWHRLETCSTVNVAVAFDFSSRFEVPGFGGRTYSGVAREPTASM